MKYEKHYNIVTSCDDKLAPYVAVNLTAISRNLKNACIDFFLLHSRIGETNIRMLKALCKEYRNIMFHEVIVPNHEEYVKLSGGGGWSEEAYYPLCTHEFLPDSVDRALYLDAGDTLVVGDIEPYYACDFHGKSLVVTPSQFKIS